jgi:glycosyltransferase involved in cell wall biosynthesis
MARIGINPARGKLTEYTPAQVSVAAVTYVPHLEGYFQQRLQILKLTFASLTASTNVLHDVLVFDNGSCKEVVEYLLSLREQGVIDYLILSKENIGKIGAFSILFRAAPGEVIAYNDDDILFYPGWLEAQLDILKEVLNAGMVSGVPVRMGGGYAMDSLNKLAEEPPAGLTITRSRVIPDEWEEDWASSTGRDPAEYLSATRTQQDLLLRMGSIEAVGTASHFQFVSPKDVILKALPASWTGKLMGHMVELDEAIDNMGYLRLSTRKRYTRHLGNTLSQVVLDEARQMGLWENQDIKPPVQRNRHWITRLPGSRRILGSAYHWLFEVLSRADS